MERHRAPPPLDSIVTVFNSLLNCANNIIPCITLNNEHKNWENMPSPCDTEFRSNGTKVKYVTTRPPSPPSLMFHFLKSS